MDAELRALVRDVAAEPVEGRHRSEHLPALEAALKRAGLLSDDPAMLPALGKAIRAAGLTCTGRKWESGVNFQECLTDEEFRALQEKEAAECRDLWKDDDLVKLLPEDEVLHWHAWMEPPVGMLVARRFDNGRGPRASSFYVVTGSVGSDLLSHAVHAGACRCCSCFELTWGLGFWTVDCYHAYEGGRMIRKVNGGGADAEGFIVHHEAPHCIRPAPEFLDIPLDMVRESVKGAFLRRRTAWAE